MTEWAVEMSTAQQDPGAHRAEQSVVRAEHLAPRGAPTSLDLTVNYSKDDILVVWTGSYPIAVNEWVFEISGCEGMGF